MKRRAWMWECAHCNTRWFVPDGCDMPDGCTQCGYPEGVVTIVPHISLPPDWRTNI